nr:ANTAR domain-containing protein [Blastococcus saxobsidens]
MATARADYGRLEAALRSRLDIGIAMGILMERHRLPQEQAFDVLRSASQRQNVKLSEIAARMVSTGSLEA